jgi:hypothetical protein
MCYQTLRSVSNNRVQPSAGRRPRHPARSRAPSWPRGRGPVGATSVNLVPNYWLDLEDYGYVLVRCELAVFKPEV